jgi:acyl dehydratase
MKLTIEQLGALDPGKLGVSRWHKIDQSDIDRFAEATNDHSWLHVDAARARQGPFGETVAHGYLTLSLVPMLVADILTVTDMRGRVNYGIDRVRFTSPVRAGSDIRASAELLEARRRSDGLLYRLGVTLEIDGSDRPGLVGELLFLVF